MNQQSERTNLMNNTLNNVLNGLSSKKLETYETLGDLANDLQPVLSLMMMDSPQKSMEQEKDFEIKALKIELEELKKKPIVMKKKE